MDPRSPLALKGQALAGKLGLDRADRMALAGMVAWRDVDSWKELTCDELERVVASMEGFLLITYLRWQNGGFEDGPDADLIRCTSER